MAFLKIRQTAWDQIKAAVANAAEAAGDTAGDLKDAAVDVHHQVHGKVKDAASSGWDAVQSGAQSTADVVSHGVAAVGHGVSATTDKVGDVANGVIAGAIAGAIASWAMNRFQAADAAIKSPGTEQATSAQLEASQSGGSAKTAAPAADGHGENATTQVAQKIAGRELTEPEKASAGTAVHYGYGAAMGALYGGLTELLPSVGMGLGIPYATAMWLFGDEIAVSALGLGKPVKETTPAEHATGFASHLVYGITLDISRRVLRHIV